MKSLKKRIFSGAMAGVLALSLAVPAFAANNTTEIDGSFKSVTIDVVVPSNAVAFINPYALDIEVPNDGNTAITDSTPASDKTTISGQQIVSAPMALKNRTAMDLNVAASVTGTVKDGSTMRFAAASAAAATTKSAYVYLQAKQETTLTGADSAVTNAGIATACANWAKSAYDASKDVIVSDREATQEHLVNLKAATMTSGAFSAYAAGSIALVRLSGDCPSTLREPWVAADGFNVTVAYTFTPATKYAITLGSTGAALVTVGGNLTSVMPGETVTLTATGLSGGQFIHFTVETVETTPVKISGTATDASSVTATFVMPEAPVNITATVDTSGPSDFVTT